MANVLLVDPNETARKAFQGILARGNHRFFGARTAGEAWAFIRRNVKVDLVFVELKLKNDDGLDFIGRLRRDALLKLLPVVIYTATTTREVVTRALLLKIQNILVKPYRDTCIFEEVAKALSNPWRSQHLAEPNSFCKMTGLAPEELHRLLDELRRSVVDAATGLIDPAQPPDAQRVIGRLGELSASAESAGAWGVVECLDQLRAMAEAAAWPELITALAELEFVGRLISCHLNPDLVPAGFLSTEEIGVKEEEQARARWFSAPARNGCPVVTWPQLESQLEALVGCPVVDSVAAGFQMAATGHPSSLGPLMDLAEKDPGLAAQLLITTNSLRPSDAISRDPVENPRLCIGLLGETRLAALATNLLQVQERRMQLPPCTWPHFWMMQIGVARMARYTCRYLELYSMEARAYTAGLLHDLGKLLLLHLHPHGFAAIHDHARRHAVPLREAEKMFLGCTTAELAAHFAERRGLPKSFCHVMRWVTDPALAVESAELVAIVSFAYDICLQNHVGWSGDTPKKHGAPLEDTAAWKVLATRVFPSFDLKQFKAEAHAECRKLRQELHGRLS